MGSVLSLLKGAVGFPLLAALAVVVAYYARVVIVQPNYNKDFHHVEGLDGPVVLRRDGNGLLHVTAATRGDALFGQGFAHGQDRLWQIEFQRLVGSGELASVIGVKGVQIDTQSRTLNFRAAAQRMCANAPEYYQGLMQRYVDGLNFYVDNNVERPAEFVFMGAPLAVHKPKPFVRSDACLIAVMLMWQMGQNVPFEVDRFNIFWNTNRTFDQVMELFNNGTNSSNTILTAEQLGLSEADAVAARAREATDHALERQLYDTVIAEMRSRLNPNHAASIKAGRDAMAAYAANPPAKYPSKKTRPGSLLKHNAMATKDLLEGEEGPHFDLRKISQSQASNAWVSRRAGARPDGTPHPSIGASDPHLPITNPSTWHWSHLSWKTDSGAAHDVAGVGLPGLPGVHIGKTSHASWGITMSTTDLSDLFIITPDPQRPQTHYVVNGTSRPFSLRTEVIKVRGMPDVHLPVRETIYGPIVTEALELPREVLFAYHTDYLRNDVTSVQGLMCLNDPSVDSAVLLRDKCLSRIRSPGFSIPSTDRHGNLVYGITGAHPHRRRGHTGRVPIPGNGTYDHWGVIPYTELPALTIGAAESAANGGYIGCANQKVYPDGYKYSLSYDFVSPHRAHRIQTVLAASPNELSDIEFHKALQHDVQSQRIMEFMDMFTAKEEQRLPEVAALLRVVHASPEGSAWLRRMEAWDRRATVGSVEATLFWRWWRELMRTPSDAVWVYDADSAYWNPKTAYYVHDQLRAPTPTMTRQCREHHQLGHGPQNATGCGDLAGRVFVNLAVELSRPGAEGSNRWGIDFNKLRQLHGMMHGTPLAFAFENSVPKGGDFSTVDVSDHKFDAEMSGSVGVSMRMLYDWSTPTWLRFALPGGNSGNIFSKFHKNLLSKFADSDYVSVTSADGPRPGQGDLLGGLHATQKLSPPTKGAKKGGK